MKTTTLILIGLIAGGILFLMINYFPPTGVENELIEKEEEVLSVIDKPTDFAKIGTIVFNNPGLKPGVPYIVYEEPGKPALTRELILDELSMCSTSNGATPCITMSVTLDVPFHGKRAIVEGIQTDGGVLLRKLQIIAEEQIELERNPGDVFILWSDAVSLIKNCEVEMIAQTHGLDVYLELKNGERVRAVEPVIDEVFRVYDESVAQCGNIPVATE